MACSPIAMATPGVRSAHPADRMSGLRVAADGSAAAAMARVGGNRGSVTLNTRVRTGRDFLRMRMMTW